MTEEEILSSFGVETPEPEKKVVTVDYCVVLLSDVKRVSYDYGDFQTQYDEVVGEETEGEVVVLERTRVPLKSFTLVGDSVRLVPTKLRVLPPEEVCSLLNEGAR